MVFIQVALLGAGAEESELLSDQPFEYNVNKVLAENLLWQLSRNRAVEVVVLRDGQVVKIPVTMGRN